MHSWILKFRYLHELVNSESFYKFYIADINLELDSYACIHDGTVQ